jgi:hypothetical protein
MKNNNKKFEKEQRRSRTCRGGDGGGVIIEGCCELKEFPSYIRFEIPLIPLILQRNSPARLGFDLILLLLFKNSFNFLKFLVFHK